jgi:1-acyl-sn-glycerol-3-phosphate acyltransferase
VSGPAPGGSGSGGGAAPGGRAGVKDGRPGAGPIRASDQATLAQRAIYPIARGLVAGFAYLYWRVRVSGRENVPATGPFVVAPLHRSNIDTPLMGCVTRRRMRYLAKDTMWAHRSSAWFVTLLGGIPVRRGTPDREALRACEAAVRSGQPVVIFPEGTRRTGPLVEDIFEGAAFVALRTGAPIIPVGIAGSERAMPRGSRLIHPTRIRIVIGPAIHPPPRADKGRGSRRQVHEMTERLQAGLQDVSDRAWVALG